MAAGLAGFAGENADLIAVVEGGAKAVDGRETLFGRVMAGGDSRWFGRGMGLSVRQGKILTWTEHDLAGSGRAVIVRTEVRKSVVEIVLVDLDASPLRSRAGPFEALSRLLEAPPSGPRLVLGDFNTPWESHHFDEFRRTMEHAHDRAGIGMAPTWPLPLPVLEIDHVWGRGVRFTQCLHEDLGASDHLAVVFDFTFSPAAPPRAPSAR